MQTRGIVLSALYAVLTALAARISVPLGAVPVTLQVLVVLLSGFLLGKKLGALSQVAYIAMGLFGFPVFTTGGGIQSVLSPTFGYILGFVPMAWCAGRLTEGERPGFARYLLAGVASVTVLYAAGATFLLWNMTWIVGKPIGVVRVIQIGVLPFIVVDAVKAVVAASFAWKIRPRLRAGRE